MRDKAFGQLLVREGVIDEPDFARALQRAGTHGTSLVSQLTELRFAQEREIAQVAARACRLDYLDLTTAPPSTKAAIDLVPAEFARAHHCIPLWLEDDLLTVGVANPLDMSVEEELFALSGRRIRRVVVLDSSVKFLLQRLYSLESQRGSYARLLDENAGKTSSEQLVKAMLVDSIQAGGDLHIMPTECGWRACLCIEDEVDELFEMTPTVYEEVAEFFKSFLAASDTEGGEFRIRTSLNEEVTFFLDVDADDAGEQLFVCLLERKVVKEPNDVSIEIMLPRDVAAELERAASDNGMCIGSLIQKAWTLTRDVINTACVCPCANPHQDERTMTVRLPRETVSDLEDAAQINGRSTDWVLLKMLVMARECLLNRGKPKVS